MNKKICGVSLLGLKKKNKSGSKRPDHKYNMNVIFCLVVYVFVWVLWDINLWWLFNAKTIFIQINSSISNNSVLYKYIV